MNEVYDSTSKGFTVLKLPFSLHGTGSNNTFASFSVGRKLFVYIRDELGLISYDVIKKTWYKEPCVPTFIGFSTITAPRL